jgi:signal transduction histidine kinase
VAATAGPVSGNLFTDPEDVPAIDAVLAQSLDLILEYAPSAFAVTRGPEHTLIHANGAFRRLVGASYAGQKIPITQVMQPEAVPGIRSLLDRALSSAEVLHDQFLGSLTQENDSWNCTIWPFRHTTLSHGLVIELEKAAHPLPSLKLQREITERLLRATLREAEAAERAETSRAQSEFIAQVGQRLGRSLDASATRETVAGISPPIPGTWCIVDLIESDGSISRLAMIHPDPRKHTVLQELAGHWVPEQGDPFGGPAMQPGSTPLVIADNVDAVLEAVAHSPENLRLLRELEIGALLTVPMVKGDRLLGALTFVSGQPGRAYSWEEISLAQSLATRNAEALENARIYGEALLLREQAELATRNKLRFLGNISHELRTPLNAIVGYVDVMAEGIHGPVTPAQHRDLDRIKLNQEHLLNLVNELLTFVRAGTPRLSQIVDVLAHEAVAHAVRLLGPTLSRKSIRYQHQPEDGHVIALGDPERVRQILVNLLANAVKFSAHGGQITTRCEAHGDRVRISVRDNGIGIAPSQLGSIFEPFVQVDPLHPTDGGVGLGLAISRDLALTMQGDLAVTSTLGQGACFTLTLPRARAARQ